MKITLNTSFAGPRFSYGPGETVDIDDAEARRLIKAGLAVPARGEKVEKSTQNTPEKAVKTSKKK